MIGANASQRTPEVDIIGLSSNSESCTLLFGRVAQLDSVSDYDGLTTDLLKIRRLQVQALPRSIFFFRRYKNYHHYCYHYCYHCNGLRSQRRPSNCLATPFMTVKMYSL